MIHKIYVKAKHASMLSVDIPQVYLWSKFEDFVPFGYIDDTKQQVNILPTHKGVYACTHTHVGDAHLGYCISTSLLYKVVLEISPPLCL